MDLKINGENQSVDGVETVEELIARLAPGKLGIAVAINDVVIPRAAWATTNLGAGDSVEIIQAVQGG